MVQIIMRAPLWLPHVLGTVIQATYHIGLLGSEARIESNHCG